MIVAAVAHGDQSCVLPLGLVTEISIVPRFGPISRAVYIVVVLTLSTSILLFTCYKHHDIIISRDEFIINAIVTLYTLLAIGECFLASLMQSLSSPKKATLNEGGEIVQSLNKNTTLSTKAIIALLKLYVWSDKTSDSTVMNRLCVIMTWICVISSKGCNFSAPVLVSFPYVLLCASITA